MSDKRNVDEVRTKIFNFFTKVKTQTSDLKETKKHLNKYIKLDLIVKTAQKKKNVLRQRLQI